MSSALPNAPVSLEDLSPASLASDKCSPPVRSLSATSPLTKRHHAGHPNALTPNIAESLKDWPDGPGTPSPSAHLPSNTSYTSIPPQSLRALSDTPPVCPEPVQDHLIAFS